MFLPGYAFVIFYKALLPVSNSTLEQNEALVTGLCVKIKRGVKKGLCCSPQKGLCHFLIDFCNYSPPHSLSQSWWLLSSSLISGFRWGIYKYFIAVLSVSQALLIALNVKTFLRYPPPVSELLDRSDPRLLRDPQWHTGIGLGHRPVQRSSHPQASVQHHPPDQFLLPQWLLTKQTRVPHHISR